MVRRAQTLAPSVGRTRANQSRVSRIAEVNDGVYFVRDASSCGALCRVRSTRRSSRAPNREPRIQAIFRLATEAGERWDCEPRFARLDRSLQLLDSASGEIVAAINVHPAAATICEACGAPVPAGHSRVGGDCSAISATVTSTRTAGGICISVSHEPVATRPGVIHSRQCTADS